jgi:hypothetical protein
MFSQKIAQVTSTDTDATLQNLNVKLDLLKEEYNAVASQPNTYSFFNLDNIYFWFVLAGLLLLAFGLLFLLAEIQNKSDKTKKNKKVVLEEEFEVEENDPNLEVAEQAVETLKDLGIDTTEVEAEIKEEIKKPKTAKKASWFKKEKKPKKVTKEKVEESAHPPTGGGPALGGEEIVVPEVEKSKAKGPIKIKVEKIK